MPPDNVYKGYVQDPKIFENFHRFLKLNACLRISYATTLVLSGLAVIQLYYRIKLGKPIEIGQEKFD
jgi:uncharacterized membrane protein